MYSCERYFCSLLVGSLLVRGPKFLGCFLLHKRATPEQSLKCDRGYQLSRCMRQWKHCRLVVVFQVFLLEDVFS